MLFYTGELKFVFRYRNLGIYVTTGKKYSVQKKKREYADFVEKQNQKNMHTNSRALKQKT